MEFLMKNKSLIFMRETGSNPPVDFLSSKRGSGSSYIQRRQPQNDRHTVTNLKSVNDNQTVSQKQMNQFPSPCFIFAAYFSTILQDSITLVNNTFFETIENYLTLLFGNFSRSKGLIFVL